jgi:CheY-like chemotaxis protein
MNIDLDLTKPCPHDVMRLNLFCTEGSPAEKHEFLGSVGHELRNPLTNIIAHAETLVEGIYGPLESAQKTALAAIQDSARQMLQLIADVVDLGRIEAGSSLLTPAACLVNEKCTASVAMVAELARARSIQMVSEVQPPNLTALADVRRLQQIITELLSAAVLSTPTGGQVRLRITHEDGGLHLYTQGGTSHAATIAAHSRVEEETLPAHLLSRLGKVKPIGLALLQKLVHLQGGSFSMREAAAQEVSMSIRLPLSLLPAAEPVLEPNLPESPATDETPAPAHSHQPTILIADDQPSLLAVTRNYLESLGFHVITARDGSEAVHQALTLQPDLILMDVRMPGVDGLNAIRQIRASADPKTRDVAIVSLSGHASATDKEKCLAAGATAYLNKPFGVRELDRLIADHIRPQDN